MDLKTSFKILGLDLQADPDQAKQAYKAHVRRWHPDQFPEGSTTKAGAEEQLKQINIAYARVKEHVALHRPDPVEAAVADPPQPSQNDARSHDAPTGKSPKRSWVDHLFDTLNAFTSNRTDDPQAPAADKPHANRRRTFEQVLNEMTGGKGSSPSKRKRANVAGIGRRGSAGNRRYRRHGSTVGAVGGTKSPGPVKPVSRVRGIGRSR